MGYQLIPNVDVNEDFLTTHPLATPLVYKEDTTNAASEFAHILLKLQHRQKRSPRMLVDRTLVHVEVRHCSHK